MGSNHQQPQQAGPPLKINIIWRMAILMSFLPLWLLRLIGGALGYCAGWLNMRPMKVARINLRLAQPQMSDKDVEKIGRKRLTHIGKMFCETPKIWRMSNKRLDKKIVEIEGLEYIDAALANDKGTIVIIPHYGNWEVIGMWLSHRAPMTSLYKPPKQPLIEQWVKDSREVAGATLVPTNVRGVSAVMKALKRGEVTGILPDHQPPLGSGDFAPYFDFPALTMTLIHNLIQRTGSQAIICLAELVPGGWKMIFKPVSEDLYSADQQTHLVALNRELESVALLKPEQYQWEYKRYRVRPDGNRHYYPKGT